MERPCNTTWQTKSLPSIILIILNIKGHIIYVSIHYFLTVFADIKLPEIDEVCDRRWQHCQVIIWHAQSVEYLAVKQLLAGGERDVCNIVFEGYFQAVIVERWMHLYEMLMR